MPSNGEIVCWKTKKIKWGVLMNLFLNLKTSAKLISAFVIIAMLLAFVGFFGINTTNSVSQRMSNMYHNNLLVLDDLSSVQVWYQQMR
jgi:methyl-accepting chemotaxis protein